MRAFTLHNKHIIRVIYVIISFSFAITLYAQPCRIPIIPFTVNSRKDLSAINNGIYDLLTARLAVKDTITIISPDSVKDALAAANLQGESAALLVGAQCKASYIIFGALTDSGENVTVTMSTLDISNTRPPLSHAAHDIQTGEVIPLINRWVSDIHKRDYFRKGNAAPDTARKPEGQPNFRKSEKRDTNTVDTTTKPREFADVFSGHSWKSTSLKMLINGIALGDVDRDGAVETVIATPKKIMLYRCTEGTFSKIADIKKMSNSYPVSIDVADINGNGTPEIFVTGLDVSRTRANSIVLEYDGTSFKRIARNIRYYVRAAHLNDSTTILLGQTGGKAFSGKIFEMKWDKKKYSAASPILPSRAINVLGAAFGNVTHNNDNSIVAYDGFDNIGVFNSHGEKLWSSNEAYGGSTLYFNLSNSEGAASDRNVDYLPMRIVIQDINKDGKTEIVAVKNHAFANNILGNIRRYKKSSLVILSWDGYGLTSQWESEDISSYIRDFAIGDFDNDGNNEFVAALVVKQGKTVFVKSLSAVIAYDLNH